MFLVKIISKKNNKEYSYVIMDENRLMENLKKYKNHKKVDLEVVGELCLKF